MKQIRSRKCSGFFSFAPGPYSHPDLKLMRNFSLESPLESFWGFRKVSVEHRRLPEGWAWTGYQACHQCVLTSSGQQPRGIIWWQERQIHIGHWGRHLHWIMSSKLWSCRSYTAHSPLAPELKVWLQLPTLFFCVSWLCFHSSAMTWH